MVFACVPDHKERSELEERFLLAYSGCTRAAAAIEAWMLSYSMPPLEAYISSPRYKVTSGLQSIKSR